jgi:2-keto-3-deoxy-L-rhamnonate aldolase RhmA
MVNLLKEKLKRGEVVVVINPDHPSPSLTEFVGGLGFDGLFIDCVGGARARHVQGSESGGRPIDRPP